MNPPFTQQLQFFNHAAQLLPSAELYIVWVAGLNVRLWTIEDKLCEHMHLLQEWMTPPGECSCFFAPDMKQNRVVRTVVQVWQRKRTMRQRWAIDPSTKDLFTVLPDQKVKRGIDVCMMRTGSAIQVGKAGVVGGSALVSKEEEGGACATFTKEALASMPIGTTKIIGTLPPRGGTSGTAMILRPRGGTPQEAEVLVQRINAMREDNAFRDLMFFRSSSGGSSRYGGYCALQPCILAAILRRGYDALSRPIEYIDGKNYYGYERTS